MAKVVGMRSGCKRLGCAATGRECWAAGRPRRGRVHFPVLVLDQSHEVSRGPDSVHPGGRLHQSPPVVPGRCGKAEPLRMRSLKRQQLWAFFALTLLIGWFPWYTGSGGIFLPAPTLAAFLVAGLAQGRQGMAAILRRMLHWRVGWQWYAFVLLVPAALCVSAVGIHVVLGGRAPEFALVVQQPHRILLVFVAFALPWQSSAFLEEIGFRGYALAAHQEKWGPLVGTLILGVFFGAWFLPEFLRPDTPQYAMGGIGFYPWYVLTEVGWSLLMTWVYNRTNQSALVSGYLFHVAFNAWALVLLTDAVPGQGFPAFDTPLFIIAALVVAFFGLLIVLRTGGRLGYELNREEPGRASP